jgi:hypothetical protein
MSGTACKDYLKDRQKYWESEGFERIGAQVEDAPVFRRRRFSLTKFGIVDTFIVPTCIDGELTPDYLAGFSSEAFNVGLQNKNFLPRGFGGLAVVYPLFVVTSVSNALYMYISEDYNPKHFASFEFPAIYNVTDNRVMTLEKTPVWGAAYYGGFRTEAQRLFG